MSEKPELILPKLTHLHGKVYFPDLEIFPTYKTEEEKRDFGEWNVPYLFNETGSVGGIVPEKYDTYHVTKAFFEKLILEKSVPWHACYCSASLELSQSLHLTRIIQEGRRNVSSVIKYEYIALFEELLKDIYPFKDAIDEIRDKSLQRTKEFDIQRKYTFNQEINNIAFFLHDYTDRLPDTEKEYLCHWNSIILASYDLSSLYPREKISGFYRHLISERFDKTETGIKEYFLKLNLPLYSQVFFCFYMIKEQMGDKATLGEVLRSAHEQLASSEYETAQIEKDEVMEITSFVTSVIDTYKDHHASEGPTSVFWRTKHLYAFVSEGVSRLNSEKDTYDTVTSICEATIELFKETIHKFPKHNDDEIQINLLHSYIFSLEKDLQRNDVRKRFLSTV